MPAHEAAFHINEDLGLEICGFTALSQKFPCHFHEHYLLGCLLAGQRKLICSGGTWLLQPFDLVVVNAFQPHACEPVAGSGADWLCVHLRPDAMRRLAPDSFAKLPFFSRNVWRQELGRKFAAAIPAAPTPDTGRGVIDAIRQILREMAGEEQRHCCCPPVRMDTDMGHAIGCVCRYLEEHAGLRVSLDEMAACARLDKFRLLRAFSAIKGITPYRYLENLRLNLAKKMLLAGSSITDTALNAGFFDQSHFNRLFKANLGFTPGFFQKACLGSNMNTGNKSA